MKRLRYRRNHPQSERQRDQFPRLWTIAVPAYEEPQPKRSRRKRQQRKNQPIHAQNGLSMHDLSVAYQVMQSTFVWSVKDHQEADA